MKLTEALNAKKTPLRKSRFKKGDQVHVIAGKAKGQVGEVLRVDLKRHFVFIKDVALQKRHTKPRQKMQSDRAPSMQTGGIVDKPMPIDASNVMLVCPRCDRVTRIKHERLGSGESVRVCGHCREQLEADA